MEEGVIKFDLHYTETGQVPGETLAELNGWRRILWQLALVGQDPARYGGYGFGNVSQRIAPFEAPAGKRQFVISGTQTGGLEMLDASHYAVIGTYDPETNRVIAGGPVKPSSESLTHGMIYDLATGIHAILHVHSPHIWQQASVLNIPVTDTAVAYGTPAMAQEAGRLFRETDVLHKGIFSMGGHEDGIVAFGTTPGEAGGILLNTLAKSYSLISLPR
jgi:ribulose-5-phosphate 4-epimerase/fuculose-1-phosphate aldolase